ncbi:MAG: alpha/beta fold hydrolase [Lewinella sp.]|nr:alpha/beta fold hydrolase [Lewinella sp.]
MIIAPTRTFTLPDGCRLAYQQRGPQTGTPVVFLNGILMNMQSWEGQYEVLEQHHPCLLYDLRGQLRSDKDFAGEPRMVQHVVDLLFLLRGLGIESCHLVGTSYGGEVAMLFARTHPERVRSLSVIASVSCPDELLRRQVRLWMELAGTSPELFYDTVATYSYSPDFLVRSGDYLDQRRSSFTRLPAEFFTGFRQLCRAFLACEMPPGELEKIQARTLVIAGELDILKPPRHSRVIAERIAGAEYHELAGAGHALVIEQPAAVNDLLREFLEKA